MVGIGGGVPSKVKLGYVVIGTSVDEYQGVAQWDLRKEEKDGVFRRTGGLDSPPCALLTGVDEVQSRQDTRSITNIYLGIY